MSHVRLIKDLELVYDDENNQLPALIWKISDDKSTEFNVTNVKEDGRIKPGVISRNYRKIFKSAGIRHDRVSKLFEWCVDKLDVKEFI